MCKLITLIITRTTAKRQSTVQFSSPSCEGLVYNTSTSCFCDFNVQFSASFYGGLVYSAPSSCLCSFVVSAQQARGSQQQVQLSKNLCCRKTVRWFIAVYITHPCYCFCMNRNQFQIAYTAWFGFLGRLLYFLILDCSVTRSLFSGGWWTGWHYLLTFKLRGFKGTG